MSTFDVDQIDKKLIGFQVQPEEKTRVTSLPTAVDFGLDEKMLRKQTKALYSSVLEMQQRLYAEKKQSVLLVLQAMDAAGKDSTIRKLTTRLNVQGCRVASFGKPTSLELSHDFLWRIHQQVPAKGEMVVFNRSHYEDVLIVKVHEWCSDKELQRRYAAINEFENLLADNGTKVIKVMLNISPEYQLSRFKSRLENPNKNWKFNPGDLVERRCWEQYMEAFNVALEQCSTESAPWYVIPAEIRWFRDYAVTRILYNALLAMDPQYPEPDFDVTQYSADSIS